MPCGHHSPARGQLDTETAHSAQPRVQLAGLVGVCADDLGWDECPFFFKMKGSAEPVVDVDDPYCLSLRWS